MKWSWFKVPVKVEQINEYLFSDTNSIKQHTVTECYTQQHEIWTQRNMNSYNNESSNPVDLFYSTWVPSWTSYSEW